MATIKLTKTVIDAATPRNADYTLWDAEVRGLGLRVSPKGRKVYVVFYRTEDGTQRRPAIGVHGAITLQQARQIAQGMLGRVRAGEDPSRERKEARAGDTVADLCDRYLDEYARPKKKPGSVRMDGGQHQEPHPAAAGLEEGRHAGLCRRRSPAPRHA